MSIEAHEIAKGRGWQIRRFICSAGPEDRPFEERHDAVSISLVQRGSFDYRSAQGSAAMVPGALLLGSFGHCFRCAHSHSRGDECLSFQFSPEIWDEIATDLPGQRRAEFSDVVHPPDWALLPVLTEAAALTASGSPIEAEECALLLAGAVLQRRQEAQPSREEISARDRGRIGEIARFIEERAETGEDEALLLEGLAARLGMSRFRFLRLFRRTAGMTPHQFLLRIRMSRAAHRLRTTREGIATIAFDAGFGDLSTFNRRFRRLFGQTPTEFRRLGLERGIGT